MVKVRWVWFVQDEAGNWFVFDMSPGNKRGYWRNQKARSKFVVTGTPNPAWRDSAMSVVLPVAIVDHLLADDEPEPEGDDEEPVILGAEISEAE